MVTGILNKTLKKMDELKAGAGIYFLSRIAFAAIALCTVLTLVFATIHLGPMNPAEQTVVDPEKQQELEERKRDFNLTKSLSAQYKEYLQNMFTFDFGKSWTGRYSAIKNNQRNVTVNTLLKEGGIQTMWLWLWTFGFILAGVPLAMFLGFRKTSQHEEIMIGGSLLQTLPVFLLALLLKKGLVASDTLIGIDWTSLFITTEAVIVPFPLRDIHSLHELLRAVKLIVPPSLILALPLLGLSLHVSQQAVAQMVKSDIVEGAMARGVPPRSILMRYVIPNASLPLVLSIGTITGGFIGGTIVVEYVFGIQGLGNLFLTSLFRGDYTTFQAILFLSVLFVITCTLLRDLVYLFIVGVPDDEERSRAHWTTPNRDHRRRSDARLDGESNKLQPLQHDSLADDDLLDRLRKNWYPVLLWLLVGGFLILLELGAILDLLRVVLNVGSFKDVPTLLSRHVISNTGYRTGNGQWVGTFLGLPPSHAWAIRVSAVYLYALVIVGWLISGYKLYRSQYRLADRTPLDKFLIQFQSNRWGVGGAIIVFVFLIATIFAPTLGPTTSDRVLASSSLDGTTPQSALTEQFRYRDRKQGRIKTVTVRTANSNSGSIGVQNFGLFSYDNYGRFHPFGTTVVGTDLFTEMLHGLRVYLFVGVVSMVIAGLITVGMSVVAGTFTARVDYGIGFVGELLTLIPVFPLLLLLSITFDRSWITDSVGQIAFLAIFFGIVTWPALFRTVHLQVIQIRTSEWLLSEKAIGQSEITALLQKSPNLFALLLPYLLGGINTAIVTTAALSYLGHGTIDTLPYEWATLISAGSQYIASVSWHVSLVPALSFIVLVIGISALADGVHQAINEEDSPGISSVGQAIRISTGS